MTTITAAAVTAVQSPFNTSPAYSGTFIPTVWSSKLNVKFYANTTFGDVSNTNWEGEIKNMGDKVVINNIPSITINAYTVGQSLTYEVPTPDTIELQIDKAFYFGVNVSDVLEYQAQPNLMDMFTTDAGNQLKVKVDSDCFFGTFSGADSANKGATAGAITGGYNLGTDLAPLDFAAASNPPTILNTITALGSVLDEQNVPETDRFLVITPYERQLLMASPIAQAYVTGDSQSPLRNGKIGRIDRFDIYVSNLLPKGAAGKSYMDPITGTDSAVTNALKRHAIIAGHKSAMTFASQINKVESIPNPNDFGTLVRGLMVYGRKTVKGTALAFAAVKG
jgi:hypothetical protein